MSQICEIQDSELEQLLTREKVVIIYLMASLPESSRQLEPIMEQLAKTYSDRVTIVKLDINKNKNTLQKFRVYIIPAILIFKYGLLVEKLLGVASYENFRLTIDQHL